MSLPFCAVKTIMLTTIKNCYFTNQPINIGVPISPELNLPIIVTNHYKGNHLFTRIVPFYHQPYVHYQPSCAFGQFTIKIEHGH